MVIIKAGSLPEDYRGECPECGCVFICTRSESYTYSGGYGNSSFRHTTCPTDKCRTQVKLTPFNPTVRNVVDI